MEVDYLKLISINQLFYMDKKILQFFYGKGAGRITPFGFTAFRQRKIPAYRNRRAPIFLH
ncbi:hypothetical protein DOE63_15790 [Salmonella enterica subsp. diarizonae serovar 59:z10:-]|nr:hypothetical protein DOE63_15790 [Salmonella enterica subsp. diarizonae serovar 59:z10:-]